MKYSKTGVLLGLFIFSYYLAVSLTPAYSDAKWRLVHEDISFLSNTYYFIDSSDLTRQGNKATFSMRTGFEKDVNRAVEEHKILYDCRESFFTVLEHDVFVDNYRGDYDRIGSPYLVRHLAPVGVETFAAVEKDVCR